ncbi:Beta-catenin-like protein 1 [Schistosoma japonicum]|nr:Beta-catenin-like protein 1 [Schistosoma japonicum]
MKNHSCSFDAPDSWNSETSNEPTTVGANEVTGTTVRQLTEAQTKFPDQLKRFMQSELGLHETLEEIQASRHYYNELVINYLFITSMVLAANPELYPILAEQSRPISLLCDKKDEADGVHKTLGIVESLLEIRSDMNMTMANQGLFSWLLRRLQKRAVYNENKLYVSELLSILLQISLMLPENKDKFSKGEGIQLMNLMPR